MTDWKKEIYFSDIKKQKTIVMSFYVWLLFSVATALIYRLQLSGFMHIDVPTHIMAGVVITAFIFTFVEDKNMKKAFLLAMIPFLFWELIEITMSTMIQQGFVFHIFYEPLRNRIQDVAMDTIGFIGFIVIKRLRGF